MKKYFLLMLAGMIFAIFSGWVVGEAISVWQKNNSLNNDDNPVVLTTFTVLADMTKNVAGEKAKVYSITKPGSEIHGYEPTPQDLVNVKNADVVLDNGLGLEVWAEDLYQSAENIPHYRLSEGVDEVAISEGSYQGRPNPHAWISPKSALIYVDNIKEALSKTDPKNSDYYEENAKKYKQKIAKIDTLLTEKLADKNLSLVSCEGAFSYLARDYQMQEYYLWAINSDSQGTPQQVAKVVESVKNNNIAKVFCESTVSDKAMREVAKSSDAEYGGAFFVDSLSDEDGEAPTYLDLLKYNTKLLVGENE